MSQSKGIAGEAEPVELSSMMRRSFLAGAGLVASGALLGGSFANAATMAPGGIVETTSGKVRGLRNGNVHIFKGVRYGAPTWGANRFMPPVKPERWAGVKNAYAFGHQSPQNVRYTDVLAPQADPAEGFSEDCLFLNVWTPGINDGRKRPVMFWCHGGGFTWESGSWQWVDGAALARRGDVVVVTVNHRLGIFGYLSFAELGGARYAASGNAGMLDLMAALQWVRDNIAQFGGDPDNVMLFGQSGGGAKVATLMAMPAAKGLFHRAAIQSGAWVVAIPQEEATAVGHTFLSELNIGKSNIDAMQRVPVATLLAVKAGDMHPAATVRGRLRMGMAPVVDGRILPAHPFEPVAPQISAHVPLLIGCTRQETSLFFLRDEQVLSMDDASLVSRLRQGWSAAETKEIIDIYRQANPNASPADLYLLMTTDHMIRRDTILMAERKHGLQQAPVFMYSFDWQSPALEGRLRAPHCVDIPFVFDNTDVPTVMTRAPSAAALAAITSEAWISFARSGAPGHPRLPAWPAYEPGKRATMIFDNEPHLVNDPNGAARIFWASREP